MPAKAVSTSKPAAKSAAATPPSSAPITRTGSPASAVSSGTSSGTTDPNKYKVSKPISELVNLNCPGFEIQALPAHGEQVSLRVRKKITDTKDELRAIVMAYDYEECEWFLKEEVFPVLSKPQTADKITGDPFLRLLGEVAKKDPQYMVTWTLEKLAGNTYRYTIEIVDGTKTSKGKKIDIKKESDNYLGVISAATEQFKQDTAKA